MNRNKCITLEKEFVVPQRIKFHHKRKIEKYFASRNGSILRCLPRLHTTRGAEYDRKSENLSLREEVDSRGREIRNASAVPRGEIEFTSVH